MVPGQSDFDTPMFGTGDKRISIKKEPFENSAKSNAGKNSST